MKPCLVLLTCIDGAQADIISDMLLAKHLAVCIKKFPISSSFLWKGHRDTANEVLLLMETDQSLFQSIEKAVKPIHSYDTPILTAIPLVSYSSQMEKWMKDELRI